MPNGITLIAVVSEIELLWCSKKAKHSRRNNPTYIYYIANYEAVKLHEEKLLKETEELEDRLNLDPDKKKCTCGVQK
jgi:hypothetical protein